MCLGLHFGGVREGHMVFGWFRVQNIYRSSISAKEMARRGFLVFEDQGVLTGDAPRKKFGVSCASMGCMSPRVWKNIR